MHSIKERQLAVSRLHTNGASPTEQHGIGRPTLALAKRVLGRWRWYGCSLLVRATFMYMYLSYIDLLHGSLRSRGKQRALGRTI